MYHLSLLFCARASHIIGVCSASNCLVSYSCISDQCDTFCLFSYSEPALFVFVFISVYLMCTNKDIYIYIYIYIYKYRCYPFSMCMFKFSKNIFS